MKPYILAITGKIGAGKSTVASILKEKGWGILDSDKIVHQLYEPGNRGADKIQTFFGEEYLKKDGSVNRKKLIRALLKNTKKWDILNRLIHPLVLDELKREIKKLNKPQIAIELQIYNERLFGDLIDELWVIESPQKTRTKRIKEKTHPAKIEAIEAQQEAISLPKDATIINNSGSTDALKSCILKACPPTK